MSQNHPTGLELCRISGLELHFHFDVVAPLLILQAICFFWFVKKELQS